MAVKLLGKTEKSVSAHDGGLLDLILHVMLLQFVFWGGMHLLPFVSRLAVALLDQRSSLVNPCKPLRWGPRYAGCYASLNLEDLSSLLSITMGMRKHSHHHHVVHLTVILSPTYTGLQKRTMRLHTLQLKSTLHHYKTWKTNLKLTRASITDLEMLIPTQVTITIGRDC